MAIAYQPEVRHMVKISTPIGWEICLVCPEDLTDKMCNFEDVLYSPRCFNIPPSGTVLASGEGAMTPEDKKRAHRLI